MKSLIQETTMKLSELPEYLKSIPEEDLTHVKKNLKLRLALKSMDAPGNELQALGLVAAEEKRRSATKG